MLKKNFIIFFKISYGFRFNNYILETDYRLFEHEIYRRYAEAGFLV